MHMADALISPAVGGTMWAATAGLAIYSAHKIRQETNGERTPLMGVMGALIFAVQMISFSIPGTGSSGHLGGALLLAILLGPYASFIVISSILAIQALFFADGGLLAFGCNLFNLGFCNCFIGYLCIYKPLAGKSPSSLRNLIASLIAAIIGMQLTALGVVVETEISGISNLPFTQFLLLMQPIHFVIGVIEGVLTAATVNFIRKSRPEILATPFPTITTSRAHRQFLIILLLSALLIGGVLSWFASTQPEGLEWAVFHFTKASAPQIQDPIHLFLGKIQHQTAFFMNAFSVDSTEKIAQPNPANWFKVHSGTSIIGIVGALLTLFLTALIGLGLHLLKGNIQKRKSKEI